MLIHTMHSQCPSHTPPMLFFFQGPATTEIYTLSLHDALPICAAPRRGPAAPARAAGPQRRRSHLLSAVVQRQPHLDGVVPRRSEEHTSELQSRPHLVCRLLLEKKKKSKK